MPKGDYRHIKFKCRECNETFTVAKGYLKDHLIDNICLDCRGGGIYGKAPTKEEIFAARAKARKKQK